MILEMLGAGRLHLAGISELKAQLTADNYEEVLSRATRKSKEEIKRLVAELKPKPDAPPRIRKRPRPKAKPEPLRPPSQLCPDIYMAEQD